jgi:hypothetical protein
MLHSTPISFHDMFSAKIMWEFVIEEENVVAYIKDERG